MVKSKFFWLAIVVVFIATNSCVENYWPNIDKYENALVVDGEITNSQGPYIIRLSTSTPINNSEFFPKTDCSVMIMEKEGSNESLQEVEPGIYTTHPNGIQGIVGHHYKIVILTPEGGQYESDFEELSVPVGIDSVFAEVEYQADQAYPYDLAGYQFYINSSLAEQDTNYFLWDLEATYHYQSDYTIRWFYDGTLNWFHGPDSLYNCWSSYRIGRRYLQNTETMTTPQITNYPFHFVNTETRQLSVRYSLMVKQYMVNKQAYQIWKGISDQNWEEETLYQQQPYQIRGNVKNISNPDDPVLGYFLVAGITQKRIFVDRPEYPVPMRYSVCTLNDSHYQAYGELVWADPVFYPIYAIETNGGRRAVPPQGCVDCRLHGGTITKPDFWID